MAGILHTLGTSNQRILYKNIYFFVIVRSELKIIYITILIILKKFIEILISYYANNNNITIMNMDFYENTLLSSKLRVIAHRNFFGILLKFANIIFP